MKKMIKKILATMAFCLAANNVAADPGDFGQTIQIYTSLKSFFGKPSWLLIIRDIDHNQNIPYMYDFEKGDNFWLAFTFGREYLITASRMTFNPYKRKIINNFCGLESFGRIIRGQSLYINITGKLTPNTDTFSCSVMRYQDSNFSIAPPAGMGS